MPTENKATTADAQLILQLYDLRREAEMRKARNFIGSFSPKSFEDVMKIVGAFGNQENAWFRQVYSYWEMAASLVLRGAVDQTLFDDNSAEMYFVYAKIKPFLKQLRETLNSPEFLIRIERAIERNPDGQKRLALVEQRIAKFEKMRAQSSAASD